MVEIAVVTNSKWWTNGSYSKASTWWYAPHTGEEIRKARNLRLSCWVWRTVNPPEAIKVCADLSERALATICLSIELVNKFDSMLLKLGNSLHWCSPRKLQKQISAERFLLLSCYHRTSSASWHLLMIHSILPSNCPLISTTRYFLATAARFPRWMPRFHPFYIRRFPFSQIVHQIQCSRVSRTSDSSLFDSFLTNATLPTKEPIRAGWSSGSIPGPTLCSYFVTFYILSPSCITHL